MLVPRGDESNAEAVGGDDDGGWRRDRFSVVRHGSIGAEGSKYCRAGGDRIGEGEQREDEEEAVVRRGGSLLFPTLPDRKSVV